MVKILFQMDYSQDAIENDIHVFFEVEYRKFLITLQFSPENFWIASKSFKHYIKTKHDLDVEFIEITDTLLYEYKILRDQLDKQYGHYMVFGGVIFHNYDQYVKFLMQYGGTL